MTDTRKKAEKAPAAKNERENLCRRCGACCHEKLRIGKLVLITDIPCEYLDVETKLCRIYDTRSEIEPRCLGADEAKEANAQPADCPYVAGAADYFAPLVLAEHPEYENLVNEVYPDRAERKAGGKKRQEP